MIIYGIECSSCKSHDVFMTRHMTRKGNFIMGIYCDRCCKWIKWANKEERRAYERCNAD